MEKVKFEFNLEELEQLAGICIDSCLYRDRGTEDYNNALDFFGIFVKAYNELERK